MDYLTIQAHIGLRLRQRRHMIGKSQVALGAECGVTFQQIQKYETGASAISATRLWGFACALGVPISYFYEGLPGTWTPPGEEDVARCFERLAPLQRDALLGFVGALKTGEG